MSNRDDLNTRYIAALLHILSTKALDANLTAFITELILNGGVPSLSRWMALVREAKARFGIPGNKYFPYRGDMDNDGYYIVGLDTEMGYSEIQRRLYAYEQSIETSN